METIFIYRIYNYFTGEWKPLKFGCLESVLSTSSEYISLPSSIDIVYIDQVENAIELIQSFHNKYPPDLEHNWYNEDKLETMKAYIKNVSNIDHTIEN